LINVVFTRVYLCLNLDLASNYLLFTFAFKMNGNGGRPTTSTNERKEKSVLQSKLTKLAIQIGYAGKVSHEGMLR